MDKGRRKVEAEGGNVAPTQDVGPGQLRTLRFKSWAPDPPAGLLMSRLPPSLSKALLLSC